MLALAGFGVQAQTCKLSISATTPDSRFVVNGQEVSDTQTGLIWQKCPLGTSGGECSTGSIQTYTWSEAIQAAEAERQLTGKSWRLPNIKELLSIVEDHCYRPAINKTIFPYKIYSTYKFCNKCYWSATPLTNSSYHEAWLVDFDFGSVGAKLVKTINIEVRLVRTGQ